MMSAKNMIERFGKEAHVYRKTTTEDELGYKSDEYAFLKSETVLTKKPSQAWGEIQNSGNLVKRENITFIAALDTEIQEGDKLIINLENFIVLKVSKTKAYSLVYLDRSVE